MMNMSFIAMTMKAKNTLQLYNEQLEGKGDNIYSDGGVSINVKDDNKLELSFSFNDYKYN